MQWNGLLIKTAEIVVQLGLPTAVPALVDQEFLKDFVATRSLENVKFYKFFILDKWKQPKMNNFGFLPILSLCLEFNDINIKSSIDLATKFECGNLQNSIFSQKGPNYENWGILGFISIVSNRIDSSLDAGAV